jgi:CSLREA domain-containing protein
LGSLLVVGRAHAATFTVDSTGDGADQTPGDGNCQTAPPVPRCTLRAAIQEANALAGADIIAFGIAGAGVHTISPTSVLPAISQALTIDGTTQPGYVAGGAPLIEVDGVSAGGVIGLDVGFGVSATIRSLCIDRYATAIRLSGSNNILQGNYLGTDPTGTLTGRGNAVGVYIRSNNNQIDGTTAAGPNVISGNTVDGIQIDGAGGGTGGDNNVVSGNYIGVNAAGTAALGNTNQGIAIFNGASNNTIGGTAVGAGNVISANDNGIAINSAGSTGNLVQGNWIGTDKTGTVAIGNTGRGVTFDQGSASNTVGGTVGGAGNIIANNGTMGVWMGGAATINNAIEGNSIFANGGLGIDLNADGVSPNDAADTDVGPNNLRNFPVLSAAMTNGAGSMNFAGSYDSAPTRTYRVEFFSSSAPDPTGYGEGERYLGFTNITTDAAGHAILGVTLPVVLAAGEFVTATATDIVASDTSEFSNAVVVLGSLVVTTTADTVDGTTTSVGNLIANPGADGRISLREAIQATNATAGGNTVTFGIPLMDANHLYYQDNGIGGFGAPVVTTLADLATPSSPTIANYDVDYPAGTARSWYRIQMGSALPPITSPLVLIATTQPLSTPGTGPVIEVNGGGFQMLDLQPGSSGSTIRGFVIENGNFFGIRIQGSSNNVVVGNFLGTNVAGTAAGPGNTVAGVYIGGSAAAANDNRIGGTILADRNIISANAIDGIEITGGAGGAARTLVQGNFIGTDVTGTVDLGNTNQGIAVFGTLNTNTVIGGTAPNAGNVISGNNGYGILIASAGTSGTLVQGNKIGTNAAGTAGIPNTVGIRLDAGSVSNNTIGGTTAAEANIIAFNGTDGIRLTNTAGTGNSILRNSIYSNGSVGIDLNDDGLTPNDSLDADGGPNSRLNFPFATAALESAGTLTVYFKLDVPAGWYRVELFKNPSGADPSGNGEGQVFAGTTNVNHPGGGSVNFNTSFAGIAGDVITATTTVCTDGAACSLFGSTSEFGNALTAVPTAVTLMSFTAAALDGAVDLSWTTGSELNNLGFHLYRSLSSSGPFERITNTPVPGLGSSPVGATYSHRDTGLSNGATYFYELEDIETTGRTTFHGPVSATPETRDTAPSDEGELRTTLGDPSRVSLRVVERTSTGALLELETGGFFATTRSDGSVRLEVPGFEELALPGSPSVPVKRTWLEAFAGRGVRIASIRELEVTSYAGFRPASGGTPEVVALPGGVVQAGRRRGRGVWRGSGLVPATSARVVETGFQEEVKKALLELAPLRWDGSSERLLWARRLEVRVSFSGMEPSERSFGGSRGRRRGEGSRRDGSVLARLSTTEAGLYRVRFEDVFARGSRAIPSTSLRLSRLGEAVPYHIEPSPESFGSGSTLYFLSAGAEVNPYSNEAVYELERGPGGQRMAIQNASPSGPSVNEYFVRSEWEQNRYYQAGLLEAPSLWLWDVLLSPVSRSYPFTLHSPLDGEAKLEVYLQGASDFEAAPDHHVRAFVNGSFVSESSWDGTESRTLEASVPAGVLREGRNDLTLENVGDTGASYSMVFLDRFVVTCRERPVAAQGELRGSFQESGRVSAEGLGEGSLLIQTSPGPSWISGASAGQVGIAFHVEAGRSYLGVSPEAVLSPSVRRPSASTLKSPRNRADYLVVGPREFLAAAEPLLDRRRSQKLVSRAVAIEDVFQEFGYGEPRPEALKAFLEYAYQNWQAPSVRYVVLLGDGTYDGKDFLQTGVVSRVPAFPLKTSYLWTASDPSYALVNGKDGLPDLALGRLPAANAAEARTLVQKVLAYEESGQDLSGRVVMVADDSDAAGDFEADSEEIAAGLPGRDVVRVYLRDLGAASTRSAISDAFDGGASLLSYVGHGGIALWASENVLSTSDVESLRAQSQQPIVMTLSCLNGYFHFPYFDALGEALVKAEGKGAIAAVSPSGLSLDGPAHLYHQALMNELTSARHRRLGDAILAAQRTYAANGAFPELLTIYQLFGDPALVLR